jgi:hypothetical protein
MGYEVGRGRRVDSEYLRHTPPAQDVLGTRNDRLGLARWAKGLMDYPPKR